MEVPPSLNYTVHCIPLFILLGYISLRHNLLCVSSVGNFSINQSLLLAFLTPHSVFSHRWIIEHIHSSVGANRIVPSCLSNILSLFSFRTFLQVADCSEVMALLCFHKVFFDIFWCISTVPGLTESKIGLSSQKTWWLCDLKYKQSLNSILKSIIAMHICIVMYV